jgi:aminoglycoside phosphotransferase
MEDDDAAATLLLRDLDTLTLAGCPVRRRHANRLAALAARMPPARRAIDLHSAATTAWNDCP